MIIRYFIILLSFLFLPGNLLAATGGSLSVTSSADSVAIGSTVNVTVAVSANASGATSFNSAGIVLQWDKNVFALDGSSTLGTAGDNDPHATAYLDGEFGNKQNDDNSRITMIWTPAASDLMELRLSDSDASGDPLYGTSGQAYVNYTRTGSFNQSGAVVSNYQFFTVKLVAKTGATVGNSTVSAKFIAVSDNKGSTIAEYTTGSKSLSVVEYAVSPTTISLLAGQSTTFTLSGGNSPTWSVDSGNGTLSNTSATGATYTAPTSFSGSSKSVTLTVSDTVGGQSVSKTADITVYMPSTVGATSGNGGSATVGGGTVALTATLKDGSSNAIPVSGGTVTFTITSNTSATSGQGAYFTSAGTTSVQASTNASGVASATLTMGQTSGSVTVTATYGTLIAASYTVTANPGTATQLALSSSHSTVSSYTATDVTLTGTLKDQYGNVATTDTSAVTFSVNAATYGYFDTSGTTTKQSTPTNGVATATLKSVALSSSDTDSHTITVDASTTAIVASSVTDLTVTLAPFSVSPATVSLLAGQSKAFTLTGGTSAASWSVGASTNGALSGTGATGGTYATPATITGSSPQSVTLTVTDTLGGQSVSTSAAIKVYAPSSIDATTGNNGSATVGGGTVTLTATLKDASGAIPVADGSVTFAITSNTSSTSGKGAYFTTAGTTSKTATTDSSGVASVTLTMGETSGSITVTASYGSLTAATYSLTANPGSATQMALSASASTVSSYHATDMTLTGTLKDQYGNVATTDTSVVTFTVDASTYGYFGTSGTASKQVTPSNGVAATTLTSVALATTDTTSHAITADASTTSIAASSVTDQTISLTPFYLTPTTHTMMTGQSKAFTLTGGTSAASWSVDSGTMSSSSSTGGTYTAPSSISGTSKAVTLTVTDSIGKSVSTTAAITVYAPASIAATTGNNGSATVGGGTVALEATIKDANGTAIPLADETVTFSISSNTSSTSGKGAYFDSAGTTSKTATTNASGLASVTLTLGETAGNITVTASYGTLTNATFAITANPATPTTLALTASTSSVSSFTSTAVTLTGTLKDTYGNVATNATTAVAFSIDAATYGYFDTAGTTSKQVNPTNGVASATLTSVAVTDTTPHDITVSAASGSVNATNVKVTLSPFSLSVTSVTLVGGDTKVFTASGGGSSTTWSKSSGTLSATTGDSVTYTAGSAAATDTLTASDTIGGSAVSASAAITIYAPVATSVTSATGMVIGKTLPLLITGGNGSFTCTSSDTAVATVTATATSSTCTITAVAAGSFTVKVADTATYNGVSKTANEKTTEIITVVQGITVTSQTATDGKVYLDTDSNKSYTITASGGKGNGFTYASATPAAATVSSTGVVTAVATGSTVITIADKDLTDVTQTLTVVVLGPLSVTDAAGEISSARTVASGDGLKFTPAGGSSGYAVTISGPGSYAATLTAGSDGAYTFTAPSTGAFAGTYTITVSDASAGLSKTITVNVPFKIAVKEAIQLSTDTSNYVTVTGGAASDAFKFSVLDGNGVADTSGAIAGLAATAGGSASTTLSASGNPATAYIAPKNTLTAQTRMKVKAVLQAGNADSTEGWASVTSDSITILPMATYTIQVNDTSGVALANAKVTLKGQASDYGLTSIAIDPTNANGQATINLPTGGTYSFEVVPVSTTTHQSGSLTITYPNTSGTVTLRKISAPMKYTGTLVNTSGASPSVKALDANGNVVEGSIEGSTFTLWLDTAAFTPVRINVTATDAILVSRPVTDATAGCVNASGTAQTTLTTQTTCVAVSGNVWQGSFGGNTFELKKIPVITTAQKEGIATLAAKKPSDFADTFTDAATGLAGTKAAKPQSATSTASANDPVILVMKDPATGAIVSAPVVHQPLSTAQTAMVSGAIVTAPPSAMVAGAAPASFDLSSAANLTTVKSVKVEVPANAFASSDVAEVFTSVRAAKLDTTTAGATTASRTSLTGGEVVEIDLVAFNKSGSLLATGSGNTLINDKVGIPVEIPVKVDTLISAAGSSDVSTINGKLRIYTAPTLQDFLANTNVETLTGATYNPATGKVTINMKHFSVVVPGVDTPAASTGGGGGGGSSDSGKKGGCFIATAAYGSYDASQVQLLRRFRDRFLLSNSPGAWFVDRYYTYSPGMADWLRGHDGWRAVVRVALLPFIALSWLLLEAPGMAQALFLAALALAWLARRKRLAGGA